MKILKSLLQGHGFLLDHLNVKLIGHARRVMPRARSIVSIELPLFSELQLKKYYPQSQCQNISFNHLDGSSIEAHSVDLVIANVTEATEATFQKLLALSYRILAQQGIFIFVSYLSESMLLLEKQSIAKQGVLDDANIARILQASELFSFASFKERIIPLQGENEFIYCRFFVAAREKLRARLANLPPEDEIISEVKFVDLEREEPPLEAEHTLPLQEIEDQPLQHEEEEKNQVTTAEEDAETAEAVEDVENGEQEVEEKSNASERDEHEKAEENVREEEAVDQAEEEEKVKSESEDREIVETDVVDEIKETHDLAGEDHEKTQERETEITLNEKEESPFSQNEAIEFGIKDIEALFEHDGGSIGEPSEDISFESHHNMFDEMETELEAHPTIETDKEKEIIEPLMETPSSIEAEELTVEKPEGATEQLQAIETITPAETSDKSSVDDENNAFIDEPTREEPQNIPSQGEENQIDLNTDVQREERDESPADAGDNHAEPSDVEMSDGKFANENFAESNDSIEPVEPAERADPIEPIEPVDPKEPMERTEPTEPTEPIEPIEPIAPTIEDKGLDYFEVDKPEYIDNTTDDQGNNENNTSQDLHDDDPEPQNNNEPPEEPVNLPDGEMTKREEKEIVDVSIEPHQEETIKTDSDSDSDTDMEGEGEMEESPVDNEDEDEVDFKPRYRGS